MPTQIIQHQQDPDHHRLVDGFAVGRGGITGGGGEGGRLLFPGRAAGGELASFHGAAVKGRQYVAADARLR